MPREFSLFPWLSAVALSKFSLSLEKVEKTLSPLASVPYNVGVNSKGDGIVSAVAEAGAS